MTFKKAALATILACSGWGAAQAEQTWAFTYAGGSISASGTFTTASAAPGAQDVLSISGVRNGVAILGLVPLGADTDYLYDNQFNATAPYFTDGGLLMAMAGGEPNVNFYFFEGDFYDLYNDGLGFIETPVSFNVTAVPEPATVLSMLAGLGLVGVQLRRRRAAA
ncbi:MAG: PEP-CTERM sorting domain-containing protein [Rubrivivax sp.]|nr:PEP-CTERM sorting domain-containing protein [Rubrivivax sp.]